MKLTAWLWASLWVDYIARYQGVLYPVIALVSLLVIIIGILEAWKSKEMDGATKSAYKREIVQELRKELAGLSAEALSRLIGLAPLKTVKLLEELQRDGIVQSHTNTERLTKWQLKGVGPDADSRS